MAKGFWIMKNELKQQLNSYDLLNSIYETHGENFPFFIEFYKPKELEQITIGFTYSLINEKGETEIGECVDFNPINGKVTLKKL